MNSLIWNCRGTGSRNFAANVRDYMRIYQLDFISILEPRVTGQRADDVIRRNGLIEGARIDGQGFSGGGGACGLRISLQSRFSHALIIAFILKLITFLLKVGFFQLSMLVLIVYKEKMFGLSFWICEIMLLGLGVLQVTSTKCYMHMRKRGAPINSAASAAFTNCINGCHLLDLGYKGAPYTWIRGDLKERLDRVLCTLEWQDLFPNSSVTHLPLMSSDHCGLWLRLANRRDGQRGGFYFKFLTPWLDHPDFNVQVRSSWVESDNWLGNMQRLTDNLRDWNHNVYGNIFKRKHQIIKRLKGIGRKLFVYPRL